jgi:anti-sigma regulatory factor (Ser/Thr protein kinase)
LPSRIDSQRPAPIGLDARFASDLSAPRLARAAVRDTFSGRIPARTVESLLTITSELVTNSVLHGDGTQPINVSVRADADGLVRGEVEDQGEGEIAIREIEDRTQGGMGLRIVRALSERWGVYEGSTHVWFELRCEARR